jgi:hypothetical protein
MEAMKSNCPSLQMKYILSLGSNKSYDDAVWEKLSGSIPSSTFGKQHDFDKCQ